MELLKTNYLQFLSLLSTDCEFPPIVSLLRRSIDEQVKVNNIEDILEVSTSNVVYRHWIARVDSTLFILVRTPISVYGIWVFYYLCYPKYIVVQKFVVIYSIKREFVLF